MTPFNDGIRQAKHLIHQSPQLVDYWLERARRGKRRWKTLLFLPGKRRFLKGFIACLEAHQVSVRQNEVESARSLVRTAQPFDDGSRRDQY
ncbi:hypothetical protein SAMN05444166_5034 [Singulisphaera sp. GP187]|uniref:hypothetical protein n=1 Tax=Singulisphaera sp. GP187 TaxID=1882752 RepID=UPI00092C3938|nr:hypothetical protein [Singulisphaera sp. GP187]SIO47240.1 hypothetical protein SAMN05444166_5034 [Singulisphaera sp. GP187]